MTLTVAQLCDNRSEADRRANANRPLTRSLDYGEEGLAMQATRPEVLERFWSHVEPTGFCWLWTGCLNRNGYGAARVGGVGGAHRVAYEILVGPIPEGMQQHPELAVSR